MYIFTSTGRIIVDLL